MEVGIIPKGTGKKDDKHSHLNTPYLEHSHQKHSLMYIKRIKYER